MALDPSSFSNPRQCRVVHTDFEIDVNFYTRILSCWCEHTIRIQEDGCCEATFDTRDLDVERIEINGCSGTFSTTKTTEALGSALSVSLPKNLSTGDIVHVGIWYKTTPGAVAVQWLDKDSTMSKKPFLFTQCQAIHARSLFPAMDTPGAKFTYRAIVRTPKDLVALMSALRVEEQSSEVTENDDLKHVESCRSCNSTRIHRFRQDMPISSYLFALAVGDLVSRDLSPVIRGWSEPQIADAFAYEFAELDKFLSIAEELAGPYRWKRYDFVVLPPSFPYGGMENPMLTFVTPTLLAQDRSLVNVMAHEMSHSWTGNLVTNADWSGFWLNEGPTVYLERRIIGAIEGEAMFQLEAAMGWRALKNTVDTLGADHKYTKLVPDLSDGADPDDAFSKIPYEKGFAFLYYIQSLVGVDQFLEFFKAYIEAWSSTPLTPNDFKDFCMEYFRKRKVHAVEEIDWDTWYYAPGMPPVENKYDESLAERAFALAEEWHAYDKNKSETTPSEDISNWSTLQILAFLGHVIELGSSSDTQQPILQVQTIKDMMGCYPRLETPTNCEIRCEWFLLRIKSNDESVLPEVNDFLARVGRMKYVRPMYRALKNSKIPGAQEKAVNIFQANKSIYHPIAAKMCARELGL